MFDITTKRALETAEIELKEADGRPMLDDKGKPLSVTLHGPGSAVWQAARDEINRRKAERMRKQGGGLESAFDNAAEDQVEFLVRITVSFNGWSLPAAEKDGPQAIFRAAYADPLLGYIRDQIYAEATNWAGFMKGSANS